MAAVEDPAGGRPESAVGAGRKYWFLALFVLLCAAALRWALALAVPLFPDETYYWEWARRPDASYFDHPPGIAWLVALGTSLLGDTRAGVRLGPAIAVLAGSVALAATARRIAGGQAALVAAAVFACMPLATAGLVLATPDAPLLAATAVCLWAVVRAVERDSGSMAEIGWWCVAGLALGAALLSKYTAVLVPAGAALGFALDPRLQRRLRSFGPWIGVGLGLAAFSPVIAWNAARGWPSFTFQVRHGLEGKELDPGILSVVLTALENEATLLAGQMALVSPILWLLLSIAVILALGDGLFGRGDARRSVLAGVSVTVALLFSVTALKRPVEPNWPAPTYLPAIVILATVTWTRLSGRWLRWGLGLGALFVAVIGAQAVWPLLPIDPDDDPIGDAHGWQTVAAATDEIAAELRAEGCPAVWFAGERFQEASELAFHLDGRPASVFQLALHSRGSQYALWPGFEDLASPGDCLVYVATDVRDDAPGAARAGAVFGSHVDHGIVERRRADGVVGRVRPHAYRGWTGRALP